MSEIERERQLKVPKHSTNDNTQGLMPKMVANQEKKDWLAISYFNFIENTNKQLILEEQRQRKTIETLLNMKKQLIGARSARAENEGSNSCSEGADLNGSEIHENNARQRLKFDLRDSLDMKSVEEFGASRNLSSMLQAIRKEGAGDLIEIQEYKNDLQGQSSTTDQDQSRLFFCNQSLPRSENQPRR